MFELIWDLTRGPRWCRVAQAVLRALLPDLRITGYMVQMGSLHLDRAKFDANAIGDNPFFLPDASAAQGWEDYLTGIRKAQNSVGAAVEVLIRGCPPGIGAPVSAWRAWRSRTSGCSSQCS